MVSPAEIKEAFSLYDKRGQGAIASTDLGDLLRALGQNPTQAEVADLARNAPQQIDLPTFTQILNRPNGFAPAGTPEEFIRGFAVFDRDGSGKISVGELRYTLTSLGERMSDAEVDDLLRGVKVDAEGRIDYAQFVRDILAA